MVVWYLLALSLGLLSLDKVKISLLVLGFACAFALYFGVVSGIFFVFAAFAILLILLYKRFYWLEWGLVLICFALFFHMIPGFHNPKILDHIFVGEQSRAFSLYYNFDKSLIPFVLFVLMPSLFCVKTRKKLNMMQWIFLVVAPLILLITASLLGALKFEFHIPQWSLYFILSNLFFVSLVEEALFRGYLQQRLQGWIGVFPALITASIVFGFSHQAGLLFNVFASLAGLIYGLAWMWSGRLWVSICVHLGLNLLHLFFFTYPLAK